MKQPLFCHLACASLVLPDDNSGASVVSLP